MTNFELLIFKNIRPVLLLITLADLVNAQSVGIGTSTFTPGSMLSVSGNLSVGTYSTTAAPSNGLIVSGNVGIGTSTVNAQLELPQNVALKVGDFYLSSGGNYAHMSDNNWYNGSAWSSNNENRVGSLIQLTSGGVNFYTTSSGTGVPTFTSIFAVSSSGTVSMPLAGTPGAGKVLTSDASGNASWGSTSSAQYGTMSVSNSTTTWVCPSGVYKVIVECWGGGGGGSGSDGESGAGPYGGGGGGGGEYTRSIVSVTPGTTYHITIGAAGTAGTAASAGGSDEGSGGAGGTTCFSTAASCTGVLASAAGGSGGTATALAGTGGAGGTGGTGTLTATGGKGSDAVAAAGNPGGTGGLSTLGGAGGVGVVDASGNAGVAPGGGGSGAGARAGNTAGRAGSAGSVGRVVLTY